MKNLQKHPRQYPLPRMCTQRTCWHGYYLSKNDIFGEDAMGYYVTTAQAYQGMMLFHRLHKNAWYCVTENTKSCPTCAIIAHNFKMKSFRPVEYTYIVHTKNGQRIISNDKAWDTNCVTYRKTHAMHSNGLPSMPAGYIEKSHEIYGDHVDMNGKSVYMGAGVINYMDGIFT